MLIRMNNSVYHRMRSDLRRPHPYALERVGFVFIKPTTGTTLQAVDYVTVPDEFYVLDPSVGAHVDHRAFLLAMRRVEHEHEGVLQVHEHAGRGVPRFSHVDVESHAVYLRSFKNANSKVTHGFLLLSEDSMMVRVWTPRSGIGIEFSLYKLTGKGIFTRIYNWLKGGAM